MSDTLVPDPVTPPEMLHAPDHALDPLGDADEGVVKNRAKVGSARPSSLLYTHGPGAIMDLPGLTASITRLVTATFTDTPVTTTVVALAEPSTPVTCCADARPNNPMVTIADRASPRNCFFIAYSNGRISRD